MADTKLTALSVLSGAMDLADPLYGADDPSGTPAEKQFLGAHVIGLDQTLIYGLVVTKHAGANTLDISAGVCYDPSSGKAISYAGGSGVSAGTLGNSQWNQVYLYDNSGTATLEVTNNAAPPSTAFAGTARQGGTNSNRRWIGSFLTDSSANIIDYSTVETGRNQCMSIRLAANVQVLNGGTDTSYTQQTLLAVIPRYAAFKASLSIFVDTDGGVLYLSTDGTNDHAQFTANSGSLFPSIPGWYAIERGTPSVYYKLSGTGAAGYIRCYGFDWAR